MSMTRSNSNREPAQLTSPVAVDLEHLANEIAACSVDVDLETWSRLRLIALQLRAAARQVDGLVIPDETQEAA